MKKIYKYRSVILLALSLVGLLILTKEHQLVYGGYEGLLKHSLISVLKEERMDIYGQAKISLDGMIQTGMELPIIFEGSYDGVGGKGYIEFFIEAPDQEHVTIASYKQDDSHKTFTLYLDERIDIDLSDIETMESRDPEERYDSLYQYMIVGSVLSKDYRRGRGNFKQEMTTYMLDIKTLASNKEWQKFEKEIAQKTLNIEEGTINLLVNHRGELVALELSIKTPNLTIDGWVCVDPL